MSPNISRVCRGILPVVCLWLFSGVALKAQSPAAGPEVIGAAQHDVSPPLREIAPVAPKAGPKHEMHRHDTHRPQVVPSQMDPVLQTSAGPLVATTAGLNFDGVGEGAYGYTVNSAPPDTNGAVGATQFMQWVNTSFAVFDKSTGAKVYGPAAGNTFWSGFGGACETSNAGDPIAQYDKAAARWVVTQPVFTSPYLVCVAISTTSDATGAYYRYVFSMPSFPDYPKLGIWSDAYYMSFNMFGRNNFLGANACALDRAHMLTGAPATMQCFQLSSSFASLLPSDLDGATPPLSGTPNFFLNFGTNSLNLWKFHADFTTPTNSTFIGPTNLSVAAFTPACNGGSCIPQLGTTQLLDSLGDRLMYRLAYRNFGTHESMVVNHSVTAGSGVGVRWYELQNPNTTPVIFQQGTYAPTTDYRWMGSIAMDNVGNIAVGYSASSNSINPAIRYTGRTPSDLPLGLLQAESTIVNGAGSQISGLNRWGDYSSMSVDPVDDCTFWYTTEYLKADGAFNWSTRIASFKFPSCGTPPTPDFSLSTTPSSVTVTAGSTASYTENITRTGFTGSVSLSISGLPAGAAGTFNPNPATGASSALMVTTSSTTPAGSYVFTVTGTSTSPALTRTSTATLVVQSPPTPDFSLSTTPSSVTVTAGSTASYTENITRTGFRGPVSLSISGLPAGAAGTFNPTSTTANSSALSVTTSSTTPAGTYTLTVTGTSGTLSHTTTVTLTVQGPNPDFSISASPASQTVPRGGRTSYTVTVTPSNGFGGTVSFIVSGLPSRASASFNPTSVTGSGSSSMTVTTGRKTPTGTSVLTITGASGSLSHSTTVNLKVQ